MVYATVLQSMVRFGCFLGTVYNVLLGLVTCFPKQWRGASCGFACKRDFATVRAVCSCSASFFVLVKYWAEPVHHILHERLYGDGNSGCTGGVD